MEQRKKRLGAGSSTGASRVRQHSGGGSQHSTAPPWRKKRRVDSAAGTSTGSGSQHLTATTSLLFADVGSFDKELQRHLVTLPRQEPDESAREEIEDVVKELQPDIYVAPTVIKTKKTAWHLEADDWEKDSVEYIPLRNVDARLYKIYDGCMNTLRRLTPCNVKKTEAIPREDSEMQTKSH